MGSYEEIQGSINAFIKRHYTLRLFRGLILFAGIEALVLLFLTSIELTLWLPGGGRQILIFVAGLQFTILFFFLIIRNLLFLTVLKSRISEWEASKIIGAHFPEIKDRLTNLIELAQSPSKNELILAGIAQRSDKLKRFPFYAAVNFKDLNASVKQFLLPVFILMTVLFSWQGSAYKAALTRIISYNTTFEKPAPFYFELLTNKLYLFDYQGFIFKVAIKGPLRPEEVKLFLNGQSFIMTEQKSHFETKLSAPVKSGTFFFWANGVRSKNYSLDVLPTPKTERFNLILSYPAYLNKPSISLNGTGSAIVPEGTKLNWEIYSVNADSIHFIEEGDANSFTARGANKFLYSTNAKTSFNYSISSSNSHIKNHNKLDYTIEVIPDAFPKIDVTLSQYDSLENKYSFTGSMSDDYGLDELYAVLRNEKDSSKTQEVLLGKLTGTLADFNYTFPNGFNWEDNGVYYLSFQVKDNDGLRNGKTTRSESFRIKKASDKELEKKRLEQQKSILNNLERLKTKGEALQKEWNLQRQTNKESSQFNYDERKSIRELLKRQKQQENLMEAFSKELTKSIDRNLPKDKEDKLLLERLERQEIEARKNAKLLEELKDVMNQLNKEEFNEKVEEFSKNQLQNQRSLEQILELTKKYYVNQLARQLSDQLNNLGNKQNQLSEESSIDEYNTQDSIKTEFGKIQESLKDLNSKNQALKRPLPWKRDPLAEESINKDIEQALKELRENDAQKESGTSDKIQSGTALKLKALAQKLSEDSGPSASASQNAEDAESLRQILENLIDFSLEQETLLKASGLEQQLRSGIILKQRELRELFEHVDDSIFALSLRQPAISESVNKNITDIFYNLDKSLELLSENQWMQINSYQQYTLTGSNNLAGLLAKILENLQESLKPGKGNGGGSNFQLPDIIQSQGDLEKQLSELGKGKKQGSEEGENPKSADDGKKGNGTSASEKELEEIYEIYKEQSRVRQLLEKQLENVLSEFERLKAKDILREMEELENSILNNGINPAAMQQAARIQNELLKLKEATLQQGEGENRISNTNYENFGTNKSKTPLDSIENATPQIEILNRQPLPLRLKYKDKVKVYFSKDD